MTRIAAARALILVLALAACAEFKLVEAGRHEIGDYYSVDTPLAWSRMSTGAVEIWTIDGTTLERLLLYTGLDDGDSLFPSGKPDKAPTYRAGMQASEIMELVTDTLARAGAQDVKAMNLRPARFGALPGFRFELEFGSPIGLEHKGLVVGAIADGLLDMIMYTGARTHYFDQYRGDVEKLIGSIKMTRG